MANYQNLDQFIISDPVSVYASIGELRSSGTDDIPMPMAQLGMETRIYDPVYKSVWHLKLVKNIDATVQAATYPVCNDYGGYSDDYSVDQPTTAFLEQLAGVCLGAIPATQGVGWIIEKGVSKVHVLQQTSQSIPAGCSLKGLTAQSHMILDSVEGTEPAYARTMFATTAHTDSNSGSVTCVIRCL